MSDVIHHARPTTTQQAARFHQIRFRANIEQRANARIIPIQCSEPESVPVQQNLNDTFGPVVHAWDADEDHAFGPIVHDIAPSLNLPPVQSIIKATAQYFGVSKIEMMSKRRPIDLAICRQVAMYLCCALTARSTPFIGRHLGNRDHSTVIHGCRRIQGELIAGNKFVSDAVDILTAKFRV